MATTDEKIPVRFFTRPGCHLCEDARELLREFEGRFSIHVEEINILRQRRFYERYKHTIPVMIIGDTQPLESVITREDIQRQLEIASACPQV